MVPIRSGPVFCQPGGVPIRRVLSFANSEGSRFFEKNDGVPIWRDFFCQFGGSLKANTEKTSNFFNERNRRDPYTYGNENKTLSE